MTIRMCSLHLVFVRRRGPRTRIECLFEGPHPFWHKNGRSWWNGRSEFELDFLVEHGGFEPPTPCLPGKRRGVRRRQCEIRNEPPPYFGYRLVSL